MTRDSVGGEGMDVASARSVCYLQAMPKQFWLVKQEPCAYSWDDFVREGGTAWTGVRNFQARNNLRAMKKGDWVFFYHSVSEKRVVGLAKVTRQQYPDPTAKKGDWSAVDLAPVTALEKAVALESIRTDRWLKEMPLITQSRLSVLPMSTAQGARLLALGQTRI